LVTLAQHDGQWDKHQALACRLAQYSDDAFGASLASWAMIAEEVDHLTDAEMHHRRHLQTNSADLIAKIEQDFDSLKRSRPRVAKPRFPTWKMDDESRNAAWIRIEYIVREYTNIMQQDCQYMSLADMPASVGEIAWSMAFWYVLGTEQTRDDYHQFFVCVGFLAHVDEYESMKMMRTYQFRSFLDWYNFQNSEEWSALLPARRDHLTKMNNQYYNIDSRRVNNGEYWRDIWKMMCYRIEKRCGKKFIDYTATS
jgi:hypothetical protein